MGLPAITGCGIDPSDFDRIPCGLAQDLHLAQPADYLEMRIVGWSDPSDVVGTKCASASDEAACEAAIASATSELGFTFGDKCFADQCAQFYVVVNRGDDVSIVNTREDARALVLPVDTRGDAVLVAMLAKYYVQCESIEGGIREVDDGYEVLAIRTTNACPEERTQYVVHVSPSGAIEEIDSEDLDVDDSCIN